ncbi:IS110-like element ISRta4 family transposase [Cupriavidus taiwanensis]|uniref:Transposase IS110 family n=2 Tax=Cupriavidus taiwanensis TaxID=164546 RepID=B3R950_CUPTR|nr:IS110-like element ISRta4 family transposase [Cupriavidus taiwanensis]CAQ71425.1 transposase IS110 family [Cupriavidus taiwanensis LMG 19424]SOZ10563.1 transposase IS110 family [Cupriavidus taiwanensis]SOZ12743.1 transposase IS110 family [Cupriavidus taiwanensis]SOZ41238.1 transposase IS110 family [Cupriavidus taiwanensis]SPC23455.1 transposase IS110 family [Cupriavidus taiwanensis]
MNTTTYGLDIAKGVFQLYWVEPSGECFNRRFTRKALLNFLAKRAPGRVALEACGSAHWWARQLAALGHKPVLLHAAFVRPFVQTNKTDVADAKAIWTAVHQPGMRQVARKTETQQAILALHGFRALRVKMRTMLINQLRGVLFEFGIHFRRGRRAGLEEIKQHMAELEQQLPRVLFDSVGEQLQDIARLDEEIGQIEIRLNTWLKEDHDCQTVAAIPGIGPLTATALVATIGDVHAFRSGRQLAAFLGLVPRQRGTGGKVNLGGISKRGDTYLRTLLIHGARIVLSHLRRKGQSHWSTALVQRRPANVVGVAMANKMARTAWALLAHNRTYDRDYVSVKLA